MACQKRQNPGITWILLAQVAADGCQAVTSPQTCLGTHQGHGSKSWSTGSPYTRGFRVILRISGKLVILSQLCHIGHVRIRSDFGDFRGIGRLSQKIFDTSTFPKTMKRLVPDGWVGLKSSGYRCHFRAFQLKLFILDTRNFGNGSVVQKLQLFEVARISEFFSQPEFKSRNFGKP